MRDTKGRYTDLEVAAVEAHFGWPARDRDELDLMLGTFDAAFVVLGLRAAAVGAEIEAGLTGFGGILWRRFPRTCRVVLRLTNWLMDELE